MPRQPSLLPGPWIRPHGEQVYEPPKSLPYVDGSDTSEEASRRALPRAGSDAMRILRLVGFAKTGAGGFEAGLTCDEVETLLNLSHQTASARIRGLRSGGWIRDSGKRRKTRRGRSAVVWEVVE